MLASLLGMDPTVQVAVLGVIGTVFVAVFGFVKDWFFSKHEEYEYTVPQGKFVIVHLSDTDRAKLDRAIDKLDAMSDSLEKAVLLFSFKRS